MEIEPLEIGIDRVVNAIPTSESFLEETVDGQEVGVEAGDHDRVLGLTPLLFNGLATCSVYTQLDDNCYYVPEMLISEGVGSVVHHISHSAFPFTIDADFALGC